MQSDTLAKKNPLPPLPEVGLVLVGGGSMRGLSKGHEAKKTHAPKPLAPGRVASAPSLHTPAQTYRFLGNLGFNVVPPRRKGEETTHPHHCHSPTKKKRVSNPARQGAPGF